MFDGPVGGEGKTPANNSHGAGLELDEFPVFANGLSMKLKKARPLP